MLLLLVIILTIIAIALRVTIAGITIGNAVGEKMSDQVTRARKSAETKAVKKEASREGSEGYKRANGLKNVADVSLGTAKIVCRTAKNVALVALKASLSLARFVISRVRDALLAASIAVGILDLAFLVIITSASAGFIALFTTTDSAGNLVLAESLFDNSTKNSSEENTKSGSTEVTSVVVLDPGHTAAGYNDSNDNVGIKSGIRENELALIIAEGMRDEFKSRGYTNVYLTREENNVNCSLSDRSSFINSKNADAAIAIHYDCTEDSPNPTSATGCHAIVSAGAQPNNMAKESEKLGKSVITEFIKDTKIPGSKAIGSSYISYRDNLHLTTHVQSPFCFIEGGFLNNPSDDEYLTSEEGKKAQIKALCDGIENYLKESGRYKTVTRNGSTSGKKKSKFVLVGDSRTDQLALTVYNKSTANSGEYIGPVDKGYIVCKGSMGISWMKQQESKIDAQVDGDTAVIINMGTNDAASGQSKINEYVSWINSKAKEWQGKGAEVYFMNTGPVASWANLKDSSVVAFNKGVEAGLDKSIHVIDEYSKVKGMINDGDYDSMGVHYVGNSQYSSNFSIYHAIQELVLETVK